MITLTEEAEKRRQILIQTIFERSSFEETELIERFKRKTGGLASIGIGRTIRELLKELTEAGALQYENNHYRLTH